jgi:hypothetical protein
MSNSIAAVTRVLMLGVTLSSAGFARAQTTPSANTEPYRHVYTQSEALFDRCDDAVRGDLYRRVVTEKVKNCPFSAAEKAEFQTWAVSQSARIAEEDRQAHAAGPVPAPADEHQCKENASEPYMRMILRRLDQFGRGKIGADGVIEEVCAPINQ